LYFSFKTSETRSAVDKINFDLSNVQEWARINGLKLNIEKTKLICLGTKLRVTFIKNQIREYPIKFMDQTLQFEENVRNLGIIMDENLTWTAHTNDVVKKVHFRLKNLSTFRHVLKEDIKNNLVKALIQPLFDYGDVVYYNSFQYNKTKLQKAQNNCIRFIANIRRYDHISEHRKRLGFHTLETRRKIRYYTFIHKVFSSKSPSYLFARFTFFANIHSYRTRDVNVLWIPPHFSGLMTSSFTVTASELWNGVDPPARSLSVKKFKLFASELFRYID
jgi:hypothetical protein